MPKRHYPDRHRTACLRADPNLRRYSYADEEHPLDCVSCRKKLGLALEVHRKQNSDGFESLQGTPRLEVFLQQGQGRGIPPYRSGFLWRPISEGSALALPFFHSELPPEEWVSRRDKESPGLFLYVYQRPNKEGVWNEYAALRLFEPWPEEAPKFEGSTVRSFTRVLLPPPKGPRPQWKKPQPVEKPTVYDRILTDDLF